MASFVDLLLLVVASICLVRRRLRLLLLLPPLVVFVKFDCDCDDTIVSATALLTVDSIVFCGVVHDRVGTIVEGDASMVHSCDSGTFGGT